MASVQSNGVNGAPHPNGVTKDPSAPIPATTILCEFISSATPSLLTQSMRLKLKELLIDYIGITASAAQSAESTPRILKAITSLFPPNSGSSTVLTHGSTFPPQYAALLNATFGHSLDFDDTHAGGSLHPGVSAISAGLAEAQQLGSAASPDQFLVALAVGYEVICRLGVELSFAAYSQGMHNTSTAGVFGAIATISVLKRLPAHTVEMAFGLAGSRAAGSMQYLDNGSHNKRLHPGFAVHDAFVCVALAEAGVVGATHIIEGKLGFLHAYSPNEKKDLARLTDRLGEKWIFVETSLKPYPACRMTHGVIEMASVIAEARGWKGGDEVDSMTIRMAKSNYGLVGERSANKLHPVVEVDAQFSAYYQAAHAYLYGADDGVQAYSRLHDEHIHALSDKIQCVVDTTQAPGMGSGLEVVFKDGIVVRKDTPFPLGEIQHPFTRDKVDKKFFGLMDPVYGRPKAEKVRDTVDEIERFDVATLLALLQ